MAIFSEIGRKTYFYVFHSNVFLLLSMSKFIHSFSLQRCFSDLQSVFTQAKGRQLRIVNLAKFSHWVTCKYSLVNICQFNIHQVFNSSVYFITLKKF